jgi:putative transposase
LAVIDQIFAESRRTYGSPRVHAELRLGHDVRVGRKRVERLMRKGGLVAVSSRRKGSTRRDPLAAPAPDLVDRDFTASGPDELWIADFTQIATWQGVAYIAVVADAYSRLCQGWRVRPDKTTDLVLEALEMAIWRRGQMRAAGAIHHTDQGSQYTSFAFTRRLKDAGITPSMGTVADALDNAMCESLIGSMKIELLNRQPWKTIDDVSIAVFEWLEACTTGAGATPRSATCHPSNTKTNTTTDTNSPTHKLSGKPGEPQATARPRPGRSPRAGQRERLRSPAARRQGRG